MVDIKKKIKELKLCLNCLKGGHYTATCNSGYCKQCKGKHNSLLHLQKTEVGTTVDNSASTKSTTFASYSEHNSYVLLPTAVINVKDNEGNYKEAIALLDTASQSSYISEELHKKLNIRKFEDKTVVSGISNMSLTISGACTVDIQSSNIKFGFKASYLIVPQVTSCMPTIKLDTSKITIPSHIKLANPRYFIHSKIDLLILVGADYVWDLFCVGRINFGKTRLGWIISGPLQMKTSSKTVHCHFLQSSDIHTQMKQFWEIVDISSAPLTLSKEDQLTENHFVSTTKIHEDGKFIVKIPLKEPLSKLGDSYEKAK
jgi:hypothetical protein